MAFFGRFVRECIGPCAGASPRRHETDDSRSLPSLSTPVPEPFGPCSAVTPQQAGGELAEGFTVSGSLEHALQPSAHNSSSRYIGLHSHHAILPKGPSSTTASPPSDATAADASGALRTLVGVNVAAPHQNFGRLMARPGPEVQAGDATSQHHHPGTDPDAAGGVPVAAPHPHNQVLHSSPQPLLHATTQAAQSARLPFASREGAAGQPGPHPSPGPDPQPAADGTLRAAAAVRVINTLQYTAGSTAAAGAPVATAATAAMAVAEQAHAGGIANSSSGYVLMPDDSSIVGLHSRTSASGTGRVLQQGRVGSNSPSEPLPYVGRATSHAGMDRIQELHRASSSLSDTSPPQQPLVVPPQQRQQQQEEEGAQAVAGGSSMQPAAKQLQGGDTPAGLTAAAAAAASATASLAAAVRMASQPPTYRRRVGHGRENSSSTHEHLKRPSSGAVRPTSSETAGMTVSGRSSIAGGGGAGAGAGVVTSCASGSGIHFSPAPYVHSPQQLHAPQAGPGRTVQAGHSADADVMATAVPKAGMQQQLQQPGSVPRRQHSAAECLPAVAASYRSDISAGGCRDANTDCALELRSAGAGAGGNPGAMAVDIHAWARNRRTTDRGAPHAHVHAAARPAHSASYSLAAGTRAAAAEADGEADDEEEEEAKGGSFAGLELGAGSGAMTPLSQRGGGAPRHYQQRAGPTMTRQVAQLAFAQMLASGGGAQVMLTQLATLNLGQLSAEIRGLSWIGQGGGGAVFQGLWQGAPVAVKFMLADSPGHVHAAALEAIVSSVVNHPNVVHTYCFDVTRLTDASFAEQVDYVATGSRAAGRTAQDLLGSLFDSDGAPAQHHNANPNYTTTLLRTATVSRAAAAAASGAAAPASVPASDAPSARSDAASLAAAAAKAAEGEGAPPSRALPGTPAPAPAPPQPAAAQSPAHVGPAGAAAAALMATFCSHDGFGDPDASSSHPTWSVRQVLQYLNAKPGMYMTHIIMEYCDRGSLLLAIKKGIFRTSPPGAAPAPAPELTLPPAAAAAAAASKAAAAAAAGTPPFQAPSALHLAATAARTVPRSPTAAAAAAAAAATAAAALPAGGSSVASVGTPSRRAGGPASDGVPRFSRRIVLRAVLRTARDIAQGMHHLHASGIIHGDLKPGNVLLRGCRSDRRGFTAMVSDFGLSKVVRSDLPLEAHHYSTITHMAPEVVTGRWLKASDVWSFGILLWQLASNEVLPYGKLTVPQILMGVARGQLQPEWPASAHPALVRLGKACLQTSPEKRPSFEAIVNVLIKIEKNLRNQLAKERGAYGSEAAVEPPAAQH